MLRNIISQWQAGLIAIVMAIGLTYPASAGPQIAAAGIGADQFVMKFGDRAVDLLGNANLDDTAREAAMRQLLTDHFDLNFLSRFVLSRHWRRASEAERADFRRVFEDYVVNTYGRRMRGYSGEKILVKSARAVGERGAYVASAIKRAEGAPISVNWRLRQSNGGWTIVDVVVEGVSMAVTQRSEFSAVIRANGGTVTALIDKLRRLTARKKNNATVAAKSF